MNKRLELTLGRLIALFVGVPLSLLVIAGLAIHEVAYAGQGSYPVRLSIPVDGRAVAVGVDSGDLTVDQATGGRLELRGTAHYSVVRSTVTWRATSAQVTVESHCHFVTGVCSFNYHVAVPAGVHEDLSAGKGDITVTGLASPVVSAATGSGNITLTFVAVPDRVTIDDAFGVVTVVLPPGGTSYKVSAQAVFGATSVKVPTSSSSRHVITVVNSSGSISITN
jgi:Putative adhesin